ncbi:MAG TPA: PAS domain-containing protein, partial [Firmicutes bacterium]|nr:PAS domain-containing protein [Bacillota bacterium]
MSTSGMSAALAAWFVYFTTNLALVALAARFSVGVSWPALWRNLIKPTIPVSPVAGLVGIVLAAAYRAGGAVTLLLFLGLYFIAQVALWSSWLKVRNENLSARYEDARANLRDLVEGLPNGVVAVDADGQVTLVNRAAAVLLGCRSEDVLGRKADECRVLKETGVAGLLREVLSSGAGLPSRELRLPSGKGEAVALCSLSVLRDAAGRP